MAEEGQERPRLTLEDVLDKVHREVGKTITVMGSEVSEIPDFISTFFHSRGGWTDIDVEGYRRTQALGYHDLVEGAKLLFDQARNIWLEKGYRYRGALLTAREHREVGSSGYEQFEVMPDTVVSIANRTLKLFEEKEEPMTVEEIRRARILAGKPTIDDTGTVTGEIVPISDSYHFLSEQRKAEVKALEQHIVSALKTIVNEAVGRKVAELTKYKGIVRDLAEGGLGRLSRAAASAQLGFSSDIADEARKFAYLDGRMDGILTPMEMALLGRDAGEQFKANPYVPLGIQKGRISVEEASKARSDERFFDVETDIFSGYLYRVALSLEPLNREGKTERGPLVLNHRTKEPLDSRLIELWKGKASLVPFSRPEDWYHNPESAATAK